MQDTEKKNRKPPILSLLPEHTRKRGSPYYPFSQFCYVHVLER